MATGRQNKLVGQTGEYLVASELSRRGLIATTFTGNVPHYDIIASTDKGKHISVQVKTSNSSKWQFAKADQFVSSVPPLIFARPKSIIFTFPSSVIIMLLDLISL